MANPSVESILNDLNKTYQGDVEKEASVSEDATPEAPKGASSDKVASTRQNLASSLDQLFGSEGQVKEAADQSTSTNAAVQLEKVANDLAEADMQATVKEAHIFGAAVFDGFLARAESYAGNAPTAKTASAPQQQNYTDDARIKEAATTGYQVTGQLLESFQQQEKVANGTEEQGIADALVKIAAHAEDCFVRGREHMNNIVSQNS